MKIEQNHWLRTTKIAHRGLWDEEIPENSLLAYENAIKNNLAIEIDVYKTSDDKIVVFHDPTLKRMTGAEGKISDYTLEELKKLRLNGTKEQIPTLKELLNIAEGKAPLLIEIKSLDTKVGDLEQCLFDELKGYTGEYAIQSFNPFSVQWYKKNSPETIRGQLASNFNSDKKMSKIRRVALTRMMFNFLAKPQFISYDEKFLPNKLCDKTKKQGKLLIAWTLTSKEREDELKGYVDNIIFENY